MSEKFASKTSVESGFMDPPPQTSPTLSSAGSIMIKKKKQPCVPDLSGRIAVAVAYILFAYMYCLTTFYGIWDIRKVSEQDHDHSVIWAVFSTLIFTFFFLMMIIAHFKTMRTSPGQMPKNYKQLHEESLPKDFFQLIDLRESLNAEFIVRKKMRKGELTRDSIPNVADVLRQSLRSS